MKQPKASKEEEELIHVGFRWFDRLAVRSSVKQESHQSKGAAWRAEAEGGRCARNMTNGGKCQKKKKAKTAKRQQGFRR